MKQDKFYSMLGLAMKAGKVVSGGFLTEEAGKSGKAALIILAEDASARTKKSVRDMCSFYQVPLIEYGTKERLGHAIGREERAAAAVTDEGFAEKIRRDLNEGT